MEIKVGGTYRTRDGDKARVVHRGEYIKEAPYCYIVVLYTNSMEIPVWYAVDGRYNVARESDYDLVAEWTEPKPKVKRAQYLVVPHADQPYITGRMYKDEEEARASHGKGKYTRLIETEREFDE
jgi:hypothetical protein